MKKKGVIFGVLLVGIVIIIVVGFVIVKHFYNLLDSKEFTEHFTKLGYTISDKEKGEFDSEKYLVASKSDVTYKIEFYEFKDEIEAKKTYKKFKKNIVNYITTDSKNRETVGAIQSKTIAKSDNEYIVISRVKNSIIFIAGTKEYENEIDKLLKDIKY